jgi:two-component system sensor histidine kinase KdpD
MPFFFPPKITSFAWAGMIYAMNVMEGLVDSRGIVHWLVGTVIATAATGVLVWLGLDSTMAGMAFLVLVVWSSTQTGQRLALYLAALCALSFNYFFLPPYHTLRLASGQEWVVFFSFIASCVVVNRVAERARRQKRHAEQRREDVERLFELAQEMMLHEDAAGLIRELPQLIARIFALDGVVLYVRDQDGLYTSTADLPESIRASLRAMTEGENLTQVIPGDFTVRTLMLGLRPLGALGMRPDLQSHEVAAAVTAQVAIALARATAIEASTRMEAAREGERLRTALVDSLTHELRTPLTSIRAAATTLLEGGLDEAARLDLAAIVDEEARRLDRLIGEAVEMAQIDANVVEVRLAPQHPKGLLDQAVQASRAVLGKHKVVIATTELGESGVLGGSVWFDGQLLGRALQHLLENAARFTPAGGQILLGSRRNGDRLEFSVEDDGPGVDVTDLPFIFEKFYRGKGGAGKGKGTGMGLAITRAILAAHGGGIEVENAQGKGACFRFWVPLVEKDPKSKVVDESPSDLAHSKTQL